MLGEVNSVTGEEELMTDGNGMIDRKEFHKAIRALGVRAPRAEVNTLFDTFDADGGGTLEASELAKVLRRGAGDDVKLAAGLEAGAKGEAQDHPSTTTVARRRRSVVSSRKPMPRTWFGICCGRGRHQQWIVAGCWCGRR